MTELYSKECGNARPDPIFRCHCQLYALLLELLGCIHAENMEAQGEPTSNAWWDLEQLIREQKRYRISLPALAKLGHRSRSTIFSACKQATGKTPLQRLREIRMEEARGLLLYSSLNISEIALALQYPRVHEFSREFAKHFGMPPTRYREASLTGV